MVVDESVSTLSFDSRGHPSFSSVVEEEGVSREMPCSNFLPFSRFLPPFSLSFCDSSFFPSNHYLLTRYLPLVVEKFTIFIPSANPLLWIIRIRRHGNVIPSSLRITSRVIIGICSRCFPERGCSINAR